MEIPNLCVSTIWSFDDHVSVVNQIKVSVFFHLGNNVEVFFNNKSELFIELSLFGFSFPFINIDDIPLLVKSIVSVINTNLSTLLIDIADNFHNLSSLIDDVVVLESEHLVPS